MANPPHSAFLLSGQTDSGKSTIAGHLLHLVGYFEHQLPEIDRPMYRKSLALLPTSKSKSKYSILMDLLDGEVLTEKTKTQEFAMIPFQWQNEQYTLIDTPGHLSLIRKMIDGLFQLQVVPVFILVLSALPQEFEDAWNKGTSKENLLLGRAAGCAHAIVAWNKTDVQSPSRQMLDQVNAFAKPLRFKSFIHHSVSGYEGTGLLDLLPMIRGKSLPLVPLPAQSTASENWWTNAAFLVDLSHDLLVTKGFACVCHHRSGEYEVEVIKFAEAKTRVITESTPVKCVLRFTPALLGLPGDRIILRTPLATIGFGVLHSVAQRNLAADRR